MPVFPLPPHSLCCSRPDAAARIAPALVNREAAAQLLGQLGPPTSAAAAAEGESETVKAEIAAAHRDIADMRVALFEALGREP